MLAFSVEHECALGGTFPQAGVWPLCSKSAAKIALWLVALEDFLEFSFKGQSSFPPDDTADKEAIPELLHRFRALWSEPGVPQQVTPCIGCGCLSGSGKRCQSRGRGLQT